MEQEQVIQAFKILVMKEDMVDFHYMEQRPELRLQMIWALLLAVVVVQEQDGLGVQGEAEEIEQEVLQEQAEVKVVAHKMVVTEKELEEEEEDRPQQEQQV